MNNQPMPFMQMQPMQKNGNNQMMMQLMQAALARGRPGGAGAPAGPQQGAVLPGGAMNLVPPTAGGPMGMMGANPAGMGMLAQMFKGLKPAQPGAPLADMPEPMTSGNALY